MSPTVLPRGKCQMLQYPGKNLYMENNSLLIRELPFQFKGSGGSMREERVVVISSSLKGPVKNGSPVPPGIRGKGTT